MRGGPLSLLCGRLEQASGAAAERIAFELNLAASQRGLFPRGLEELHFTRGRFAAWDVRDVWHAVEQPPPVRVPTDDLVASVNRAFLGGVDHGILAQWTSTPLCGAGFAIDGPASARCGLLDFECGRGLFRPEDGCCTIEPAAVGTICSDGVCDSTGACVPESELGDGQRARGVGAWVEVFGDGRPHAWQMAAVDAVRLSLIGDETRSDRPDPPPSDVAVEDFEPSWGGALGLTITHLPATVAGRQRVRVARLQTDTLRAVAVDVAGGADALYLAGAPTELCVLGGARLDELAPVLGDCSTGDAVRLACPGESGDLRCEHEEGYAVVRGSELTLVFADAPAAATAAASTTDDWVEDPGDSLPPPEEEPPPGTETDGIYDVLTQLFPDRVCVGYSCARPLHGHLLDPVFDLGPRFISPTPSGPSSTGRIFGRDPPEGGCELDDGCAGTTYCIPLAGGGQTCFCGPRFDICDGVDNDCDDVVDEGTDPLCDDGVVCTEDYCGGTVGCQSEDAGYNAATCTEAFCARGVCNGEVPEAGFFGGVDTSLLGPIGDNGWQIAYDHVLCERDVDGCACNGVSTCNPTAAAGEGDIKDNGGCAEVYDNSPLDWACERYSPFYASGDRNLCATEICCEPNPRCQHLVLGTQPPGGSTIIVPPDDFACADAFTRDGRTATGEPVGRCVNIHDHVSQADRELFHCGDADPCTADRCDNPLTGSCSHDPVVASENARVRTPPSRVEVFGVERSFDEGCGADDDGDPVHTSYSRLADDLDTCQPRLRPPRAGSGPRSKR